MERKNLNIFCAQEAVGWVAQAGFRRMRTTLVMILLVFFVAGTLIAQILLAERVVQLTSIRLVCDNEQV